MPNQFFDKKKGQELKQNNWKYLRDLTRTRVTKISRISWMRHFPVNWFFYSEGQSFFLHGQDKDNDSFTWPLVKLYWDCAYRQGKPPSFSTYSCERLNFPALAKIRSYLVTFVCERLELLRWFFTWKTHLFSKKNCLYRTTSNVCYRGKGTIRRCMCHFGCLPVA